MLGAIFIALMPQLPALIAAFAASIKREYPQLTDAQVNVIVSEITGGADSTFKTAIATMAAGQTPPQP